MQTNDRVRKVSVEEMNGVKAQMGAVLDECRAKRRLLRYRCLLRGIPESMLASIARDPDDHTDVLMIASCIDMDDFPMDSDLCHLSPIIVFRVLVSSLDITLQCEYWRRMGYLHYEMPPTPFVKENNLWLELRLKGRDAMSKRDTDDGRRFVKFMERHFINNDEQQVTDGGNPNEDEDGFTTVGSFGGGVLFGFGSPDDPRLVD